MSVSAIISTVQLGMILGILALGMQISLRILNIPDLTVDGSFVSGMVTSAAFCLMGHPYLGIIMGFIVGLGCGVITGLLQTKLKINEILAGIITMIGLYSINLRILGGKPNVALYDYSTIFTNHIAFLVILVVLIMVIISQYLFFKTTLGLSIYATGDNEDMVKASSINTDLMKIIGLALANGLVALAGAMLAQYQSLADVNSGIGMMVIGIASIIIAETFFKSNHRFVALVAIVYGAIAYRFILFIALNMGLNGTDLKLFSAIILVLALVLPKINLVRRKA